MIACIARLNHGAHGGPTPPHAAVYVQQPRGTAPALVPVGSHGKHIKTR